MSASPKPFSISNFNEQLLEKYQFFFTLPLKVRATAATATFISSFMVLFLVHLMLNSLLTRENLIVLYAFGIVVSGLTFSMILFPSVRRFFLAHLSALVFVWWLYGCGERNEYTSH